MEYKIESGQNDTLILILSNDITLYQVDKFKESLRKVRHAEENVRNVIIDLKDVGFIDSLALGALTTFSREIREEGGDVKLVNLNEKIQQLFNVTRLSKTYEIYKSVDKAVKSYREL